MFLKVACQEIKKRFNFDDPIPTQIECLSPAIAIDAHSRALYPTLFPLMQTVPRILDMKDTDHVQAIDDEWRKMPLMNLPASFKEMDVDEFWYNALQMKDLGGAQVFKHLASFVLDVLVFPHSNASCERVFSKVNLISEQTYHRHSEWTHAHIRMCENSRWMLKIHTNKDNAALCDCNTSLQKERTFILNCTWTFNSCTRTFNLSCIPSFSGRQRFGARG